MIVLMLLNLNYFIWCSSGLDSIYVFWYMYIFYLKLNVYNYICKYMNNYINILFYLKKNK